MTGKEIHSFMLNDIKENYSSKTEYGKKAGISPSQLDYTLQRIEAKNSHFGKLNKKFEKWGYELIIRKKS